MRAFYLWALALALVACNPLVPHISVAGGLRTALVQGDGTIVRVQHLTDFAWEQFVVFGPYTSCEEIEKTLGFKWKDCKATDIEMSDAIDLLVFVRQKRIVRLEELPRRNGDFASESLNGLFTPRTAVFIVRSPKKYPQFFPAGAV